VAVLAAAIRRHEVTEMAGEPGGSLVAAQAA